MYLNLFSKIHNKWMEWDGMGWGGWMDGWMPGWKDGQMMDGRMDIVRYLCKSSLPGPILGPYLLPG